MAGRQRLPVPEVVREPPGPGAAFRTIYLNEEGITQREFAERLHKWLPDLSFDSVKNKLSDFLNDKKELTWDFAFILAEASKTSADMWMKRQFGLNKWRAKQRFYQRIEELEVEPGSSLYDQA